MTWPSRLTSPHESIFSLKMKWNVSTHITSKQKKILDSTLTAWSFQNCLLNSWCHWGHAQSGSRQSSRHKWSPVPGTACTAGSCSQLFAIRYFKILWKYFQNFVGLKRNKCVCVCAHPSGPAVWRRTQLYRMAMVVVIEQYEVEMTLSRALSISMHAYMIISLPMRLNWPSLVTTAYRVSMLANGIRMFVNFK